MKQAITYRNIWRISFPIIVSSAAQNIVSAVDTAFLGRLSENAVGAAGNSIIFYYTLVVAAFGFSIGGEIMVGRKNGEGNFPEVGKLIDHCIYAFIPFSLLLFTILFFFSPAILGQVTRSAEILEISVDFIQYRAFGIFFALANLIFRIFYIGITHTRILITSTLLMGIVNVILDYSLIFGHFGLPAMGVKGAALASVIAEASATLFFYLYTRRQREFKKYHLFDMSRFELRRFKNLLRISAPTALQSFLAVSSWFIFFLIIEKLGERELAISHIVRSIYMVMVIPLFGFSQSTSTLVSNVIGQGDVDKVLRLVRKSVLLGLACSGIFFPLILAIPERILSVYTQNTALIAEAVPVLQVVNVAMILFALAYNLFNAVSGTGKTTVSLAIEVTTLVIYLTGTWLLGIHLQMPLEIVWYSEFVYFGVMGPLSFLYLRYGRWRNARI